MYEIIPSFAKSLFEPVVELGEEMLEMGIDSLLADGILKDLPLSGTISALFKIAINIYDRNLLKQTIVFIKTFNDGTVDPEKLKDYREMINNDTKKAEKELGRVIILLNSQINNIQSITLANFYKSYVNGFFSWETFCELSEANRRMFASDYSVLFDKYRYNKMKLSTDQRKELLIEEQRDSHKVDRLISLGLLATIDKSAFYQSLETAIERWTRLTDFGTTFCKHMKYDNEICFDHK